jgi:hypothetical protein
MPRTELWTVGLTGVLALTGIVGNYLAVKAVRDAREATRTDQRAWVGVTEAGAGTLAPDTQLDLAVIVANSGKTPALKVVSRAGWRVQGTTEPVDCPRMLAELTQEAFGVIQPGARRNVTPRLPLSLTAGQVDGIRHGSMAFYLYGLLAYEDIFKEMHETSFCLRLTTTSPMNFGSCDTFNTAD